MRTWLPIAVSLVLISSTASSGEGASTKRDWQGPVTVTMTLLGASSTGIKVRLVLDTHSGSLDGIVLEQAVSLRGPSGADIAPTAVEKITGGGHHREAVLVFPATDGAAEVRIVAKNVGGISERVFRWSLPPAGAR